MSRRIESAELIAIGTELTVGATRDTNSGDLARDLTSMGVTVERITALPDSLDVVRDAFAAAVGRVDLVVSTGGLGPTPDDLTREAIAAALDETPYEDEALLAWLHDLFLRRRRPMSGSNRKQAWLIPGAQALPNAHGTAPGWWVDRPDGRVVVAMPGPPREMLPMWQGEVVRRLHERGIGTDRAAVTLRLTGIGESALVDLLGEPLLRSDDPIVATYSRSDGVDLRISARGGRDAGTGAARTAREIVDALAADLEARLAPYVFARGDETWVDALGHVLGRRSVAAVEIGTGGSFAALLGNAPWLVLAEVVGSANIASDGGLRERAVAVRRRATADVGVAIHAEERDGDTAVEVVVVTGAGVRSARRTAFLAGDEGRRRAALAAAGVVLAELRSELVA